MPLIKPNYIFKTAENLKTLSLLSRTTKKNKTFSQLSSWNQQMLKFELKISETKFFLRSTKQMMNEFFVEPEKLFSAVLLSR